MEREVPIDRLDRLDPDRDGPLDSGRWAIAAPASAPELAVETTSRLVAGTGLASCSSSFGVGKDAGTDGSGVGAGAGAVGGGGTGGVGGVDGSPSDAEVKAGAVGPMGIES